MAKDIVVKFKVEDLASGSLKEISASSKDVAKVMKQVTAAAREASGRLSNMANLKAAFDSFQQSFTALSGAINSCTQAFAQQQIAEAKLATNMQNTMNATSSEIQAIKDLCSAQQELGVIGDEVQLAGAQELSTYLEKKSSLEKLLPVMNDMLAQQYGLNATSESAAQIATMLGKVMEGQTGALSRYGYKFDEAQEQILKFGTEEQRAAVLAEVVSASVGGMNQALAQTSSGKMQQVANALGDMKEKAGRFFSTWAGQIVSAINTAALLGTSIMKIRAGIMATTVAIKAMSNAFKWSLGVISAGIITATTLIYKLFSKTDETAGSVDRLASATEAMASSAAEAKTKIDSEIKSLGESIKSGADATDAVKRLNAEYGRAFGVHKTAAEWYDTLKTKSKDYCRQLGLEAKAKVLTSKAAEASVKADTLKADGAKYGKWKVRNGRRVYAGTKDEKKALQAIYADYKKAKADEEFYNTELEKVIGQINDLGFDTTPSTPGTPGVPGTPTAKATAATADAIGNTDLFTTLDQFDQRLAFLREKAKTATAAEYAALQRQIDEVNRLRALFTSGPDAWAGRYATPTANIARVSSTPSTVNTPTVTRPASFEINNPLKGQGAATEKEFAKIEDCIGGVADIFNNLSGAIGDNAGAWVKYSATVIQSIAKLIPAIAAVAGAEAIQQSQNMPFPLNIINMVASTAAVAAAIASLPKFAEGGIAYGPTVGLFGEYAGAANNPEVVAPLDRLKALIQPAGGGLSGDVHFFISGRNLQGVLAKNNKYLSKI